MKVTSLLIFFALLVGCTYQLSAQNLVTENINKHYEAGRIFSEFPLFAKTTDHLRKSNSYNQTIKKVDVLNVDQKMIENMLLSKEELISVKMPSDPGIVVDLYKRELFSQEHNVNLASGSTLNHQEVLFYWGKVRGEDASLAAITISSSGISGLITTGGKTHNLVKAQNADHYLFYDHADLLISNPFDCFVDEEIHTIKSAQDHIRSSALASPDNCVNMYIEVDNDIVNGKGSAQAAADYVMGAFNQVAILYANESINFNVSEIFVWDVADPYTGPSTSTYLEQFRAQLSGQYNGDLAHLVGYQGSGGIAYINVLCNKSFGVGYSGIGSSFNNVPTYGWTIEVLTHEIGHNLGSPHTHSCAWNGNNTAIDGCGTSLGYSGCPGPIPNAGTIMSYCHLVSGVGIDFNLGFGQQPGDLIRDRVYNASCLADCSSQPVLDAAITNIVEPTGNICSGSVIPVITLTNNGSLALTSVEILSSIDNGSSNTYNWTGNLSSGQSENIALAAISITAGNHTFEATVQNPNNGSDDVASNNTNSSSYSGGVISVYYADNDGDGFGDPNNSVQDCQQPNGYVLDNTDCNDNDPQIFPGATCDDGNNCTVSDIIDSGCNCAGTFADEDGDGVCDADDICPGGDDNIDNNGDGIPDFCECNEAATTFTTNPLNHQGSGSSSTTVALEVGSKNASFSIAGLGSKQNGNPGQRYEDNVTVTYEDGNNVVRTFGSYSGANVNNVNISITDIVNSLTVTLSDGYDGNGPSMDVTLSSVDYCSSGVGCPDSDGDGVCDINDVCPGGDDNIDSDGDGIPDFCDIDCSNPITSSFNPATLTHSGSGSSSSSITFPEGNTDVDFTISGLNAKTNGRESKKFIEQVTVFYTNNSGIEQLEGMYNGSDFSTVPISINGPVSNVRVELSDGYNGGANNENLTIQLGQVASCISTSATVASNAGVTTLSLFPNPAESGVFIKFSSIVETGDLIVFDLMGKQLTQQKLNKSQGVWLNLRDIHHADGMLLIGLRTKDQALVTERLILLK